MRKKCIPFNPLVTIGQHPPTLLIFSSRFAPPISPIQGQKPFSLQSKEIDTV
jgi:hypothetical protein